MQTLLLNGCDRDDEFAQTALAFLAAALGEGGVPLRIIDLAGLRIADCTGCFGCWTRTPGACLIKDDAAAITASFALADRVVLLCPVVFGGFAPLLKRVLERSISLLLPFMRAYRGELHHPVRYGKRYELCGIGILNRPDPEAADCFHKRLRRLSLNYHGRHFSAGTLVRGEALDHDRIVALLAKKEEV